MVQKTKNYKFTVELLEANRRSQMTGVGPRDSDNELIIQFMQIHLGMQLNAEQLKLLRTVNFESITRARRKLQENGEYLPDDPEVARKRKLKGYLVEATVYSDSAPEVQRRIEE